MKEIWKDIPNYEGLYQVSNLGRIKSIPHLIKANKDGGTRFTEEHIKNTSVGWHGYDNKACTPVLTITKIEPYYTIAVDKKGREYALTPTTIKDI